MKRKTRLPLFERLEAGFEAVLQGQGVESELTMPEPVKAYGAPEVASIRAGLGMTQAEFASFLNVSTKTVESWEQGQRPPGSAAARLLQVVEQPDTFAALVHQREAAKPG